MIEYTKNQVTAFVVLKFQEKEAKCPVCGRTGRKCDHTEYLEEIVEQEPLSAPAQTKKCGRTGQSVWPHAACRARTRPRAAALRPHSGRI